MKALDHPLTADSVYYEKHPSGLDIYVWPRENACSAYAVFATRYGSVNNAVFDDSGCAEELPAGIAHYLEHKLFESEDGDAFFRFAATGASANAYTSFDRTAYLFQATENILPSLEILLDFVQQPYFTPQTVQKEQGIIGQEIRMGEDEPSHAVFMNLLKGLYHIHPVRIDIAGTVDTIADITDRLLYRCYEQYYNLHNMVLIVAGKITPEEVKEVADRLLKPSGPFSPVVQTVDEPLTVASHRIEKSMPVAAPLFHLGFKEPPMEQSAESLAAVRLLLELICGKCTPLYTELMEQGLINEQFGTEYFYGTGYGVWLFGGESADPDRVSAAITDEICRLQRDGIDPEQMETVRRAVYGRLISDMEEPTACAEALLDNVLDGIEPLGELKALSKLTAAQLTEHLRRRISPEQQTLSVIVPTQE